LTDWRVTVTAAIPSAAEQLKSFSLDGEVFGLRDESTPGKKTENVGFPKTGAPLGESVVFLDLNNKRGREERNDSK